MNTRKWTLLIVAMATATTIFANGVSAQKQEAQETCGFAVVGPMIGAFARKP
jgi:hypothetical protein